MEELCKIFGSTETKYSYNSASKFIGKNIKRHFRKRKTFKATLQV